MPVLPQLGTGSHQVADSVHRQLPAAQTDQLQRTAALHSGIGVLGKKQCGPALLDREHNGVITGADHQLGVPAVPDRLLRAGQVSDLR